MYEILQTCQKWISEKDALIRVLYKYNIGYMNIHIIQVDLTDVHVVIKIHRKLHEGKSFLAVILIMG
jgi:hypothetical protein